MIRDNQKFFNRLHVFVDALVIIISYVLAWAFKFEGPFSETSVRTLSFEQYLFALVFIVFGYLILYYAFGLYTMKRMQPLQLDVTNLLVVNSVAVLSLTGILFVLKITDFSRAMLIIFYVVNITMEVLARGLIRYVLRRMRSKGLNQRHVLLVGYSRAAEEYIDRIIQNPQWGYTIRGILDDAVPADTKYRGIKVIGTIPDLMVILPQNRLDEIAITLGLNEYFRLEEIVSLCEKSGVHTKFIPDYMNIIPTRPYTEDVLGLPVINIRYVPLTNTFNAFLKRLMDITGSIVAIILFSPMMLILAILIRTTSKGPIIYKQERVGRHNKTFWMYKFRSMEVQSEQEEKKAWTVRDDPRVTWIGRFMRRMSLDELPQLFNIFSGAMSLVGPRPERPFFVEKFREEIPRYMIKHQVRPGLTGWAQVNGYRGDTSIRKRIELDLYYIENWSVGFDIKILFLTIFKGFFNKNAY